ncbi:hypothetical protein PpBr36_01504 [Pyricularia pennisetigena]|uniref:hypothetical protein n=1 Tax=Pyricularia pennisetigena TaxID=1578925 RepID=UPI00114E47B0|nr:hypothetical protein PpBr36_01504 [Pyricularia pennisetigena]TLS29205.1 hypothetical protein PpBr36_01504 [Pyricularia pennisetigena]
MLAAHKDQENLAFSRQAGGSKALNQKPMGSRYHKTPLKVPLNDENAPAGAGKSVLAAKNGNTMLRTVGKGKGAPATPLEPLTARAPLGNKTTNAKARTGQIQGVKSIVREIEKTQQPATINRPPKQTSTNRTESGKLDVHTDAPTGPEAEEEIEYAPPKIEVPYESEDFKDGVLTYEGLKPKNRLRNYYPYYHDAERTERRTAVAASRASKNIEADWKDNVDEWAVGDVSNATKYLQRKSAKNAAAAWSAATSSNPTASRAPSTIASRNAAGALGSAPRPALAPRPDSVKPLNKPARVLPFGITGNKPAQRAIRPRETSAEVAAAVSKSTLGYNKGRTASSMINGRQTMTANRAPATAPPRNPSVASVRAPSVASSYSRESTITPARFAKSQADKEAEDEAQKKRIPFLSIFDVESEDENDEPASAGDISIHGFELPEEL